jgi:hypothetical protein
MTIFSYDCAYKNKDGSVFISREKFLTSCRSFHSFGVAGGRRPTAISAISPSSDVRTASERTSSESRCSPLRR